MGLRYAWRTLRRSPGFALVAILTLALGIGINTTVFSLYGAVALKPIAAREPKRLVRLSGSHGDVFSWQECEQLRGAQPFAGVTGTSNPQTFSGRDDLIQARLVSDNYFNVLGVRPQRGRGFVAGDRLAAVASYDFWERRLQADPDAVGSTVRVQNVDLTVVGIAPERFAGTGVPPRMPDLWIPLAAQAELMPGTNWQRSGEIREIQIVARLAPGVQPAQATAALQILASSWPKVDGHAQQLRARAATFFQTDTGEFETFGQICAVLMVAVALILGIGAINLVNVLFARHAAREKEFAVRLALGAGRWQLVKQLCTESLLLGTAGGAAGFLFSLWACQWIRAVVLGALERVSGGVLGVHLDLAPDWHVFAFTAAISILAGAAIGFWPALDASRRDVRNALQQGGGSEAGYRGLWTRRNVLVSVQVAGCLVLLAGAAMLFEGAWRSGTVDPGFEMKHLLVLGMDARAAAATPQEQAALLRKAQDRIAALPEVSSIARGLVVPFLGHAFGDFTTGTGQRVRCGLDVVSTGYFETLGVPILKGRDFTREEMERQAPVVVISERAAREAWPGRNALGQQVGGLGHLFPPNTYPHDRATVIGVVANVHSTFLSKPDAAFLYLPGWTGNGLVRTRTSPLRARRAILAAIGGVDPRLPARAFTIAMERGPVEIQKMMAEAPAIASALLGGLALVLASVGIFGLVWQLVVRRTREIAIRMALGAGRRDVTKLVLWQTLRPVMVGALIGLAGAAGISTLLAAMVATPDMPDLTYGVGAFHPLVFVGALLVLLGVVLAACLAPLRRAANIAPADALRIE